MSFSPEPQDKIKFRRRTNWQVRKEIEEMRDIFSSQGNTDGKPACIWADGSNLSGYGKLLKAQVTILYPPVYYQGNSIWH